MDLSVFTKLIDSRIDDIIRWGTVTTASPLAIQFSGETASQSVKKLSSYTPTLADYVILIKAKNTYICLGKVE